MADSSLALGWEATREDGFVTVFRAHRDYVYRLACLLLGNLQNLLDLNPRFPKGALQARNFELCIFHLAALDINRSRNQPEARSCSKAGRSGNTLENSLVGIGLNLNQVKFPSSLPNPASIKSLTGAELDPEEALSRLCAALSDRYLQLKDRHYDMLMHDYYRYLLGNGIWRNFSIRGHKVKARIVGVDGFGRLLLEEKEKEVKAYSHGEAEYLF